MKYRADEIGAGFLERGEVLFFTARLRCSLEIRRPDGRRHDR